MKASQRGELPVANSKLMLISFLVVGLLVGGSTAYLGLEDGGISKNKAGETLAQTLEDQTGNSYEVVKVTESNGLYEVQLSSNNQLSTYYVTRNGEMLANGMTNLTQVRRTVEAQNEVSQCLNDKGAVMYGNLTQRATATQIQILGGASKVSGFYKDVNNPANLQEAVQRGVRSVPAIYLDGETLTNVNNLNQIRNFAGCEE